MWWKKTEAAPKEKLSPAMNRLWSFVKINHLVLATPGFIVWVDDDLDVDWKTKPNHDSKHRATRKKNASILSRASVIESAEWDNSDPKKTLNFKRQIGEAIARGLDGDYKNAEQMLDRAEEFRVKTLKSLRRAKAIQEQIQIKDSWKACHRRWTFAHYAIGFGALLLSTLVATKPAALGLHENTTAMFAWWVTVLTGLLTFLQPDKKADRYIRAWSILNSQITRYKSDESYTVNNVLDAYHRGESIIFASAATTKRQGAIS